MCCYSSVHDTFFFITHIVPQELWDLWMWGGCKRTACSTVHIQPHLARYHSSIISRIIIRPTSCPYWLTPILTQGGKLKYHMQHSCSPRIPVFFLHENHRTKNSYLSSVFLRSIFLPQFSCGKKKKRQNEVRTTVCVHEGVCVCVLVLIPLRCRPLLKTYTRTWKWRDKRLFARYVNKLNVFWSISKLDIKSKWSHRSKRSKSSFNSFTTSPNKS